MKTAQIREKINGFLANEKLDGFLKKARKLIYSNAFPALVALIVFIGWKSSLGAASLAIVVLLWCAVLLLDDNVFSSMAILGLGPFIIAPGVPISEYLKIIYVAIPLVLCFIVHFILYPAKPKMGKLFIPQLVISCAMLIGGCTAASSAAEYTRDLGIMLALGFGILAIYFFFTLGRDRDEKRDLSLYYAKIYMWVGVVLSLQIIGSFFNYGSISAAIAGRFDVGWGMCTTLSAVMLMVVPMTFFLSTKYKHGWIYIIIGLFQYGFTVLSFSRAGQLGVLITMPVSIFFALKYAYNFKYSFVATIVPIFLALSVLFIGWDSYFGQYFNLAGFGAGGFSSNIRLRLYNEAWECFKAHPVFGSGMFYMGVETLGKGTLGQYWFHNTVMQILGCMGLMGVAAYLYFYIAKYKIVFSNIKRNPAKIFILISCIGFEFQAMFDIGAFSPLPFGIYMAVIMVVAESNTAKFTGLADDYNTLLKLNRRLNKQANKAA